MHSCWLLTGKEVKLQHGAPVINITVIDKTATPLPAPLEVQHERAKAANMQGGQQVVVCSEEQIKVRTLHNMQGGHQVVVCSEEQIKVRTLHNMQGGHQVVVCSEEQIKVRTLHFGVTRGCNIQL